MQSRFVHNSFTLFLLASILFLPSYAGKAHANHAPEANVIFVDADAIGGLGNGFNWANAYLTLQDALARPPASGDQIWVAEGIYYPDEGGGQTNNNRNATYLLLDEVRILGGFAGDETSASQRNPETHLTVLSGDIDQNDNTDAHGIVWDTTDIQGNNSIHVVTGSGTDDTAILDGFTITAGNANVVGTGYRGGGMKIINGSPTLNNLVFAGNQAGYGGGISDKNSNPTLSNVDFIANRSLTVGGGIYNEEGSSPQLTDVFFSGNDATNGGGLYNKGESNTTLLRVGFSGNTVTQYGGGMYNYYSFPSLTDVTFSNNQAYNCGGLFVDTSTTQSTTLMNVTFTGNQADNNGGGMCNYRNSDTIMTNVYFHNNSADYGGGMFNDESSPLMTNISFRGNTAEIAGGGLYNVDSSNLKMYNALFSGNNSDDGGGLFSRNAQLELTNTTFVGNNAGLKGGGIHVDNGTYLTLQNTIIWRNIDSSGGGTADSSLFYDAGNSVTFRNCLMQGWNPSGNGNLDGTTTANKPLFWISINPADAPTIDGDFRLKENSPAIDVGNNTYLAGITTDLAGSARIINQIVDLGAYETYANTYMPFVTR